MKDLSMYGELMTDPCFEEISLYEAKSKYIPRDYGYTTVEKVTFKFRWDTNPNLIMEVEVHGPLAVMVHENFGSGDRCRLHFNRIVGASRPLYPENITFV